MHSAPVTRPIRRDEWRAYRQVRLRALEDSPDAFGGTLEDALSYPDSAWKARLEQADPETDLPLTAALGESLVGLAWARIEPPTVEIVHLYQMWIAPEFRGIGLGRTLVEASIQWAHDKNAQSIVLKVTCGDRPARRLYDSMGFRPVGDPLPLRSGSDLLEQAMELEL